MTDTRALLSRISAFRERLEQVNPLTQQSELAIAQQFRFSGIIPKSLRDMIHEPQKDYVPHALSHAVHHLLVQAREIVANQRKLSNDLILIDDQASTSLTKYHQTTVMMTESALGFLNSIPEAVENQVRCCQGAEAVLATVRNRIAITEYGLLIRGQTLSRVKRLSNLLIGMTNGHIVDIEAFAKLADELLDDARKGIPIKFLSADAASWNQQVPTIVAAMSLTTAQVVARIVGLDFEWSAKPLLPIIAALMMDVGMLRIPSTILGKPQNLAPDERRVLERHCLYGAELIRRVIPEAGPLADAVMSHHEMLDGTGYPDGITGESISSLSRMLAVCSQYAARCSERSHRMAMDTRTALADTLLAAEQGLLDRDFAEYLLHMTFYPVGTVVELTDGRIGLVVATHSHRIHHQVAHRPVIAVLTNADGTCTSRPEYVDLSSSSHGGIVRSLSQREREQFLGEHYPDLCC